MNYKIILAVLITAAPVFLSANIDQELINVDHGDRDGKSQNKERYLVAQAICNKCSNTGKWYIDYDSDDIIEILHTLDQHCLPEHNYNSSEYSQTHLLFAGLFLATATKDTKLNPVAQYLQKKWFKTVTQKHILDIINSLREKYTQEEMSSYLCTLMVNNPQCLACIYGYLNKETLFKEEFADAFDYQNISHL